MVDYDQILSQIGCDKNIDKDLVKKAIRFCVKYHGNQMRDSGQPYYTHPIEVAQIVSQLGLDTATLVTALLHDTIEDTDLTLEEISNQFSPEIAFLVDGVTKLKKVKLTKEQVSQAENFRKLMLAMVKDMRVLLVKLADRLHNMRTIFAKSDAKRAKICLETLEIYAPLAERIGINKIKNELQDISFANLYPDVYKMVINKLNDISSNRQLLIKNIIYDLQETLKTQNINSEVIGREKSPYSIWTKMVNKKTSFESLCDIIGFRILVHSVEDCYKTLGSIHSKYKSIPGTFHDFISSPKPNGYQSLHTVVTGPLKRSIEIQIRTYNIHEMAELGFAAHWIYKQNYHSGEIQNYKWIREIISILEHSNNSEEVLQHAKLAMYEDQIFCLTPKGDIVSLPKKAIAIDFAYALDSKLGHHCIGVKINGKLSPLNSILKTGDLVEIITSAHHTPKRSWIELVVTGKAKSEITRFLHESEIESHIQLGKNLLEGAFLAEKVQGIEKIIQEVALKLEKTVEELYLSVAKGQVVTHEIVNLANIQKPKSNLFFKFIRNKNKKVQNPQVSIAGLSHNLLVHFAKCCLPVPGDKIIGLRTSGKDVVVHMIDCKLTLHTSSKQKLNLYWEKETHAHKYITKIRIIAKSDPDTISFITSCMPKYKIGMINLIAKKVDEFFHDIVCDIEVSNLADLNTFLMALKAEKLIYSVSRVKT